MNSKRFDRWLTALSALLLLTHLGAVDAQAQSADLVVTKTLTDPLIPAEAFGITPGDTIEYTIVVTNNGPGSATVVQVSDPTPDQLTFNSNSGDCVSAFPCSLGTIPSGESRTIVANYTVSASYAPVNPIYNYAEATATSTETSPGDEYAETISPVNGINCGSFAVAGGDGHTCTIVAGNGRPAPNDLPDDVLECWGDNFDDQSSPVPAGTFDEIDAGGFTSCAIEAGQITCWGDDSSGQVTDVPAGTDFVQVSVGFSHVCALHDGPSYDVECWGDDSFGQATPPGGDFIQIAAGETNSCGVHTDLTIECWGYDDVDYPIVTDTPGDADFAEVVLGAFHACGRHQDGTVDCWGEVADFSGVIADTPGDAFLSISSGAEHVCGLKTDNTVACWGNDDFGQVTDTPVDAFTALGSGSFHTCALYPDGTVLCWGSDFYFQSSPPLRSALCPVCGDGLIEGREECEACVNPDFCVPETCTPVASPPPVQVCNASFEACCSPVTCTAYKPSENHVCRDAVGPCDAPEFCNGIDVDLCPADTGPRPNGFVCRPQVGSCDTPETCDGTNLTCPAPSPFLPNGTPCRAVAGSCDIVENCTGASGTCPANVVKAASTLCRVAAGVCDIDEVCDGVSALCPEDIGESSGTVCRPANGICDQQEVCSGQPDCPIDFFKSGAVTCRAAVAICDAAETCTGTGPNCPADVLKPSTAVCRAAAGSCDVVENCTGALSSCPPDVLKVAATPCRAAVGVCDAAESCTGLSASCPADLFSASGVLCRAAADACDVAETCTGSSNSCPANSFASTVTACNDGQYCNGADNCNGSGGCTIHAGDPCPGVDGDDNCTESCNEGTDSCDAFDPPGSACVDSDACTSGEVCNSGVCGGGTVTDCDDGDLCTYDTCDLEEGCVYLPAVADTGCLEGGKGVLLIKNTQVPDDAQMKWQWKKGEPVAEGLLGAPDIDTDYALCIFDQQGGEPVLSGSYIIPAGTTTWKLKPGLAKFLNKDAPPDGLYAMKAKASMDIGKSSAVLKARGAALSVPPPAAANWYFYHEPSVVAQLRNSEGACWSTEFLPEDFKKNGADKLKATFKK